MLAFDRIRVLLVDDYPEFAFAPLDFIREQFPSPPDAAAGVAPDGRPHRRVIGVWSHSDERLAHYFEARLLESAEAAKEYRDLSLRLEIAGARVLGERGWIPEIVLIDYDLSQEQFRSADLGPFWRITSPLPSLREEVVAVGGKLPPGLLEKPRIDVPFGERDRSGCYVGGLIAASFAAHPCVPIPTTVQKDEQVGRDTLFFEWFLGDQFFDAWENRGGRDPDMKEVIGKGVKNLRRRIEEQLRGGLVLVSLDDLARIAETMDLDACILRVESKYSVRRLPAGGLFVDLSPTEAVGEANRWAEALLTVALSGPYRSDFRSGKDLAEKLWNRYDSVEHAERYRLGELLATTERSDAEAAEARDLMAKFGVSGTGAAAKCTSGCFDIETAKGEGDAYTERARRWAALFILVRLSQRATEAAGVWSEICAAHNIRVGKTVPELLETDVRLIDAYLALFPCPEKPVVITQSTFSGAFLQRLKRIGDRKINEDDDVREFALKISDVLNGMEWNASSGEYGLMAGERRLLQMYAADLGFKRESWPKKWLA